MIRLEPKERITIPQILAHAWLKETNDEDSEEEEEEEKEEEKKENTEKNDIDLKNI